MYIGYIYKHTNKINKKVYIGQTIQKPETRWGKHGVNYSGQKVFYRDILKYSWDGFDHEIIEIIEAVSLTELKNKLNNREVNYILKFESILPTKGYNTSLYNDNIKTSLSATTKRMLEYYINKGFTLKEAYEACKQKRAEKAYKHYKNYSQHKLKINKGE